MLDIKYEIKETASILSESSKGWKKELNIISWNDKGTKSYIPQCNFCSARVG